VQQAEETRAEAEAEGLGGLLLVAQGRVVELELLEGIAQVVVLGVVGRVHAAEDHGLGDLVARQRRRGRVVGIGDRITDPHVREPLHAGHEEAHIAGQELLGRHQAGGEDPHGLDAEGAAGGHHADDLARADRARDDADEANDASVGIECGVENEAAQRLLIADGRRDTIDDGLEDVFGAEALLGAGEDHIVGVEAEFVEDLLLHFIDAGSRQVDLVDYRDDGEVMLKGHQEVGDGLRLDTLGGIDE